MSSMCAKAAFVLLSTVAVNGLDTSKVDVSNQVEYVEHGLALSPVARRYLVSTRETLTGMSLKTPAVMWFMSGKAEDNLMPYDETDRKDGHYWCQYCYTMAGSRRVQSAGELIERAQANGVVGDFIETGVWRGGISMYAKAVHDTLAAEFAETKTDRKVVLCDSFAGLPPATNEKDNSFWSQQEFLAVSKQDVQANFERLHLLDDNVKFVKGFFQHSLPKLREEYAQSGRKIAVLRGDGDMYESYMDILYNLYDHVPVGGFFICDDCPTIAPAMQAVDDFRARHHIATPLQSGVGMSDKLTHGWYWQKDAEVAVDYSYYLQWNATRSLEAGSHTHHKRKFKLGSK